MDRERSSAINDAEHSCPMGWGSRVGVYPRASLHARLLSFSEGELVASSHSYMLIRPRNLRNDSRGYLDNLDGDKWLSASL